jgi:hypothetical protein
MLVVWAVEGSANTVGQLLGAEQAVGFERPAFAVDLLGLCRLSHRPFFGTRRARILAPGHRRLHDSLYISLHETASSRPEDGAGERARFRRGTEDHHGSFRGQLLEVSHSRDDVIVVLICGRVDEHGGSVHRGSCPR